MHHFSYGLLTPILAYSASYVGCLLGLMCASRARVLTGAGRRGWLLIAAVSLGGTGIWVMHFIAMLGFTVDNVTIRYNMPLTVVSALVAIVAVGAGFWIVGNDARKLHRIALAGLLTGAGVAGMHYLGMAAMVLPAKMSYEPILFTLSVLIAVVAAAVALWFTLVIRGRAATLAAAAVMGVAVCGMHYTGMAAMRLTPDPTGGIGGTSFTGLLPPMLLVVSVVTVVLLIFVAFSASPAELVEDAEFAARMQRTAREREEREEAQRQRLQAPRPHSESISAPAGTLRSAPVRPTPSSRPLPSPTPHQQPTSRRLSRRLGARGDE
ncbi:MHYT domain-containing protein [Actinocatenispora thailandica]|nr:MHYT domain-containing protein [Actinocatenispora thailandica]